MIALINARDYNFPAFNSFILFMKEMDDRFPSKIWFLNDVLPSHHLMLLFIKPIDYMRW